jgi:hypothetical protein
MHRSSSSSARPFHITSHTTISELRHALPKDKATIYAEKMQHGVTTLYFEPHRKANTDRAHEVISGLIGTGTQEKRMALLEIRQHANKPLTTDYVKSILDKVQASIPASAATHEYSGSEEFSSFSSLSELSGLSEDAGNSVSSFSQVSLSEDSGKENRKKT